MGAQAGGGRTGPGTWAAVIAFFSLTACVFAPATVFLTNAVEFSNSAADLLVAGLVLSAVLAVVLFLLLLALGAVRPALGEKALAVVFGLGFLLWVQGSLLVRSYGPLDGRRIPWGQMTRFGLIDGLVWASVLIAAVAFSMPLLRVAGKAGLALVAVQMSFAAVLFVRQPETPSFKRFSIDTADQFVFNRGRNVVLVILDSFQSDVFDEIVSEAPAVAAGFDGFTYFRNAVGGYPFTELSVALMLTGRYYDNALPYEAWKKEAFGPASLPGALKAAGWRVDLFPKVGYSVHYSDAVASNFVRGRPRAERLLDVAYLLDLGLFRGLPHFLKRVVYNEQDWTVRRLYLRARKPAVARKDHAPRLLTPEGRRMLRNRDLFSPKAYRKSQDIRFIDALLSLAELRDGPGTFKFYHLGGPHIPLDLDENLDYVPMDVTRSSYRKAAVASLKMMMLMLDRLRRLGVYDDTMVFIVGDHGAGFQGQELVPGPGSPAAGAPDVVTQPARINALPLVLVKPPAVSGGLRTSDAPVSLADIPATAFEALGMDIDVPGDSMFAVDASAPRDRRFLTYGSRDIYSYYGDMEEYLVSGNGWIDAAWRRSGRVLTRRGPVLLRRETYRYGQPLVFVRGGSAIPYLEYGWAIPDKDLVWTAGGRALLVVPVDRPSKDLTLTVEFRPNRNLLRAPDHEVRLVVNGTPLARWDAGTDQPKACQAVIPAAIADGTLRILFEVPGATAAPESVEAEDIIKLGLGLARIVIE